MSIVDKLFVNVGRVLVSFENEDKSKGGIILVPTSQGQGVQTATVVRVGEVRTVDGVPTASHLEVGEKVLVDRISAQAKLKLDDVEYFVFRHEDIIASYRDTSFDAGTQYLCQFQDD